MEESQVIFKRKLIAALILMIILIIAGSVMGWIITRDAEKNDRIIETIHRFKEAELEIRREEKNLIIRGYLDRRFDRWQKAMSDFTQIFGELIGLEQLSDAEIKEIKSRISEMSKVYNEFIHEIQSHQPSEEEILQYDIKFKNIGRESIGLIETKIKLIEEKIENAESRTYILIAIFTLVFLTIGFYLVISTIKQLQETNNP